MRDYGNDLRVAYSNPLSGLTYLTQPISIVDEKLETDLVATDNLYIIMTIQSEEPKNNKSYFAADCNVQLDIKQITPATVDKIAVENISNQILTLLFPTVKTTAIVMSAPFHITFAKLMGAETLPSRQIEANRFIIVKQLRFRNRITQQ